MKSTTKTSYFRKGEIIMQTLVIVGAGKGLGLSLSKRFGKENFRIALIARNELKLKEIVRELHDSGIEASYFIADIYKKEQIEKAILDIKQTYGDIDVLEFSPTAGNFPPTTVLELTPESVRDLFEGHIIGAINVVNTVLPDMIKKGKGSLLFTTGLSALYPVPMIGNLGIVMAGLRNYVANLRTELLGKGIFVAHRSLGVLIKEPGSGTPNDPDVIADMWYNAFTDKTVWEEEYPKNVTPETIIL